jgi:auxin response factor
MFFKLDTSSAASIYWDARLMQTDKTQRSILAESQKSDIGMWHHKKMDIMNSKSNNNPLFRNHTEGSWLSSPRSSCPSHLLHDTTDDSKSVSAWPVSQSQSSTVNVDHVLDQVDKDNKAETGTSYRLFGIDLNDHSKNSAALGKSSSHVANLTGVTTEVSTSTLSSIDTARKSDISKSASMEKKQELQLVSPKETQSKQICSRSRTKVLNIEYIFRQYFICFFNFSSIRIVSDISLLLLFETL